MKQIKVLLVSLSFVPLMLVIINMGSCQSKSVDELVFKGDFETRDASQWEALHCNQTNDASNPFSIVSSPTREGKYAAKLTVSNNDKFQDMSGERCDLLRPDHDEKEGDEYWYAWSTYFPKDWQAPKDWFVIADWHSRYQDVCQLLQIEVTEENALIAKVLTGNVSGYQCFDGNGSAFATEQTITPKLDLSVWNDFIIHVKWTANSTGLIEIFFKNEIKEQYTKVVSLKGIPTLQYQENINTPLRPYFKLAHYRSDKNTHTSTLYHDGFRQGRTQQSIATGNLYRLPN